MDNKIKSSKEIIDEAKKLHPEISDSMAEKLGSFLSSELNVTEMNSTLLKRITDDFIKAQIEAKTKDES